MNPPSPNPLTRDPADLSIHPLLRGMPSWSDDDPRFLALCDSVAQHGVIESIKITPNDQVVDGRHRLRAARRMQLTTVPVRVMDDQDAAELALVTCLHRRHFSPGQRAFILSDFIKPAFEAAKARRLQNLRKGQCFPETLTSGIRGKKGWKTDEDWAQEAGIGRDLLRQARRLHEYFEDCAEKWTWNDEEKPCSFADYFTPRILAEDRPMGLGAALAGIQQKLDQQERAARGRKHGGGRPSDRSRQLELFTGVWTELENRYRYWADFTAGEKSTATQAIATAIQSMPKDLLQDLALKVRWELKRRQANPCPSVPVRGSDHPANSPSAK